MNRICRAISLTAVLACAGPSIAQGLSPEVKAEFQRLLAQNSPPVSPEEPDCFVIAEEAAAIYDKVLIEALGEKDAKSAMIDVGYLSDAAVAAADAEWQRFNELGRKALVALAASKFNEKLDRLASTRSYRYPETISRLSDATPIKLSKLRMMARVPRSQMRAAMQRGDAVEAAAALRRGLALARVASHGPDLLSWLVAVSARQNMLLEVLAQLHEHADRPLPIETLQTLAEAMDSQFEAPRLRWTYAVEALNFRELLERVLDDQGKFRAEVPEDDPARWIFENPDDPDARVVMPARNIMVEQFARLTEALADAAEVPRPQRIGKLDPAEALAKIAPEATPVKTVGEAVLRTLDKHDLEAIFWQGTRLMLEIELYRGRTGALPKKLAELPSAALERAIDPYSGKLFGYVVTGSTYKLYSVGLDGVDNGGETPKDCPTCDNAMLKFGAGLDFVLNRGRD